VNRKNFSEMMAYHRKKKGLSISKLAEQTGMRIEQLEAYESGDFEAKSNEIYMIANALDIPPIVLMQGKHTSVHSSRTDANGVRISEWKDY